jgi:hypothetical protein
MLPFEDAIKRLIEIEDEYTITVAINDIKNLIFERYKNVEKINSNDIEFLNFVIDFIHNLGVLCLDKNLYNSVMYSIYFLNDIGKVIVKKDIENKSVINFTQFELYRTVDLIIDIIIDIDKRLNKIIKFKEKHLNSNNVVNELIKTPLIALGELGGEIIKTNNLFNVSFLYKIEEYFNEQCM